MPAVFEFSLCAALGYNGRTSALEDIPMERTAIEALIFDFDGLIVDSESTDFAAWKEIFRFYGFTFPFSLWAVGIGSAPDSLGIQRSRALRAASDSNDASGSFDPCTYLQELTGQRIDCELLWGWRHRRWIELTDAAPLLPGVLTYIAEAQKRQLRLGLASSGARDRVTHHLAHFGLASDFDCIRCVEDVAYAKPAPDLYVAVLEGLGVRADQAIALEDSPSGVMAAKQAGVFCVAVPNPMTGHMPFDGADLVLRSLSDLPLSELLMQAGRAP
jgi:HAD superfamily hydrolase (TIGR01509 family)